MLTRTGLLNPVPTPAGLQCDIVVLVTGQVLGAVLIRPDGSSLPQFPRVLLASQWYDVSDWPLTHQELSKTILVSK